MQGALGQADLDLLLDASLRNADEITDRRVVVVATGLSRLVTARAASRTSRRCFSEIFEASETSSVGGGELCHQVALRTADLLFAVGDVTGIRIAGLVGDALHRLPDPQVAGRELVAAAPVELRPRGSGRSRLLDQVEQQARGPGTSSRSRPRAEVRVDHPILGVEVAVLDLLRELDFLGGGQQGVAARLVQEQLQRISRRGGQISVDVGRIARGLSAAVVGEADPPLLELRVERLELLLVELELLDGCAELDRLRQPASSPASRIGPRISRLMQHRCSHSPPRLTTHV